MKPSGIVLLSLLGVVTLYPAANAHEVRPAYLEIQERSPNRFDVLWKLPSQGDLVVRLQPKLSNGLLDSSPDEQYSTRNFVIRSWNGRGLSRDTFENATLRIVGLERTMTDAWVTIRFASGQHTQMLLRPDNPAFTINLVGTPRRAVLEYLGLGIEHIATGFDHLSFVLGLMLLVKGRWKFAQTITAFTVAHSITLACSTLDYVQVSAPAIESLVALSILFVAVELVKASRGQPSLTISYPWLIALTFGLLHGFAFAGSLAEIGLPVHNVPGALLLFNCGVEIGQLLFVCIVSGLATFMRRCQWINVAGNGRWFVAYGIGALAAYWMIDRLSIFIV